MAITGPLLAVAAPSYLGFRDRANTIAAANVRAAIPAVAVYFSANDSYIGMDEAALTAIDPGVEVTVVSAGAATYCISGTKGGLTDDRDGPAASVSATACT